jgi:EAL domain-containing protein (putative c-di-GMP-specific phosphodiesterase class I)
MKEKLFVFTLSGILISLLFLAFDYLSWVKNINETPNSRLVEFVDEISGYETALAPYGILSAESCKKTKTELERYMLKQVNVSAIYFVHNNIVTCGSVDSGLGTSLSIYGINDSSKKALIYASGSPGAPKDPSWIVWYPFPNKNSGVLISVYPDNVINNLNITLNKDFVTLKYKPVSSAIAAPFESVKDIDLSTIPFIDLQQDYIGFFIHKIQYQSIFVFLIGGLLSLGWYVLWGEKLLFLLRLKYLSRNNRLLMHYQPILSPSKGVIMGVEALLRKKNHQGKIVSALYVLEQSRKLGLQGELLTIVMQLALTDTKSWPADKNMSLLINVDTASLLNDKSVDELINLSRSLAEHISLTIEMTEHSNYISDGKLAATIMKLRNANILIAVDDFGTGGNNLELIFDHKFDYIKIDKKFVNKVVLNKASQPLLESILEIGKKEDIKLIAEGIEDINQMNWFTSKKIDYIQGYFFSKPLPSETLIHFMHDFYLYEKNS